MLLWEPSAPAPVAVSHDHFSMAKTIDLNVYNQLLHTGEHFEMAKSALQFGKFTRESTRNRPSFFTVWLSSSVTELALQYSIVNDVDIFSRYGLYIHVLAVVGCQRFVNGKN